jgi:hypothetical protein
VETKGPGVSGNIYSDGKKKTWIIDRYGGPGGDKPLIRKRTRGTRRRIYKRNERKQEKTKRARRKMA